MYFKEVWNLEVTFNVVTNRKKTIILFLRRRDLTIRSKICIFSKFTTGVDNNYEIMPWTRRKTQLAVHTSNTKCSHGAANTKNYENNTTSVTTTKNTNFSAILNLFSFCQGLFFYLRRRFKMKIVEGCNDLHTSIICTIIYLWKLLESLWFLFLSVKKENKL